MMLPKETMWEKANGQGNTSNRMPQTTGLMDSAAPAPTSTHFPPLKPKYSGRLWPIMQKIAARYAPHTGARSASFPIREANNRTSQAGRRHALAHVSDNGKHRRQFAVGAQNVGHTRITASVGTDILIEHCFGDQHPKQDAAQQISCQSRQYTSRNHMKYHETLTPFPAFTAPSPCSREIMRMGVPVRPNVSRIWFSR